MESKNSDNGYIKDQYYILIKIKMRTPSQDPQASSKALNDDVKDMDVLCTFKIKREPQN